MAELLIETMPTEETETPEAVLDDMDEHIQEFKDAITKMIPVISELAPQLYQAVFTGIKPLMQHEVEMRLWRDAYFLSDINTSNGRADDATKALVAFRKAFPKE